MKQQSRRDIFQSYVADLLKGIAESLGVTVFDRYIELVDSKAKDTRTGDEVALDVIKRCGLKVKKDESV